MRFARRSVGRKPELNLASMIDATFLLLAYFIFTSGAGMNESKLSPNLRVQQGTDAKDDLEPQVVEGGIQLQPHPAASPTGVQAQPVRAVELGHQPPDVSHEGEPAAVLHTRVQRPQGTVIEADLEGGVVGLVVQVVVAHDADHHLHAEVTRVAHEQRQLLAQQPGAEQGLA